MLKREDFIGTMFESGAGEDGRHTTMLITGVLGEGESGIVFEVCDLNSSSSEKWAMKMYKPLPWLEMNVLHGSFRINEELYPDHPQRMSPERRMQELKEEMIGRVTSPGTTYRIGMLLSAYDGAINALAGTFYDAYFDGSLADDSFLSNPAILIFTDPLLFQRIDFYTAKQHIIEKYADFFQYMKECMEEGLVSSTGQLPYKTVSTSALILLWGLQTEGFLLDGEFHAILEDPEFQGLISEVDPWVLFQLIMVLCTRTNSQVSDLGKHPEKEREYLRKEIVREVGNIKTACDLLIRVSTACTLSNDVLAGLGNMWMSYATWLSDPENAADDCLPFLHRAIPFFEKANSPVNLYDVYVEIARLLYPRDKAAAEIYVQRADELRAKLEGGENEPA